MLNIQLYDDPVVIIPPSHSASWTGLITRWTGTDGSVWELSNPAGGVFLNNGGIRGLGLPPITRYSSVSPTLAGSRWRGSTTLEREVFWPLFVYTDLGSQDWIDRDHKFWASLNPQLTGVWSITQPSGETRRLTLRVDDDGDPAMTVDPSSVGWELYGIKLVAEQPYWAGDPISRSWGAVGSPVNFYGGDPWPLEEGNVSPQVAPLFHIMPATTMGTAAVNNPSDVDVWPVWTIFGPSSSAQVGVGDNIVTIPFALAEGQFLRVDSNPTQQIAYSGTFTGDPNDPVLDLVNVTDRTVELGTVDFAPIPPAAPAQLNISLVGAGTITVDIVPLFLRAW